MSKKYPFDGGSHQREHEERLRKNYGWYPGKDRDKSKDRWEKTDGRLVPISESSGTDDNDGD